MKAKRKCGHIKDETISSNSSLTPGLTVPDSSVVVVVVVIVVVVVVVIVVVIVVVVVVVVVLWGHWRCCRLS